MDEEQGQALGSPAESNGASFDGPHLAAALLCERVLIEQDGTNSLVRIVDHFTFDVPDNLPPKEEGAPARLAVIASLYVSFKGGPVGQASKVRIDLIKPAGAAEQIVETDVPFGGTEGTGGFNLNINLTVGADDPGTYGFDIHLDGRRVTRVPFQVVHRPAAAPVPTV